MDNDGLLDLCGIVEPYCFLMCKAALASMKSGTVIEILVRDPQTFHDLVTILERSGETIIGSEKQSDRYRLRVRKGPLS